MTDIPNRSIWFKEEDSRTVQFIDQRELPHRLAVRELRNTVDVIRAINEMQVRGAPLLGVVAACGMYLAALEAGPDITFDDYLHKSARRLKDTRPTAVNLEWAVNRQLKAMNTGKNRQEKIHIAFTTAQYVMNEDIAICKRIGEYGISIIRELSRRKNGEVVNILTHCNAGWLACVAWGSATSAIYQAAQAGIPVHVWVDETRPRNQGASLTAWELGRSKVPHTVIADNTGGHLMQHGRVDMVITGADRVTRTGDAANKIGTYLKALAAKDNGVPFYMALPSTSIDWNMTDGIRQIPVEERSGDEVKYATGLCENEIRRILLTPKESPAANFGFDVTPSRLITGLITEKGIAPASEEGLLGLFPEKNQFS